MLTGQIFLFDRVSRVYDPLVAHRKSAFRLTASECHVLSPARVLYSLASQHRGFKNSIANNIIVSHYEALYDFSRA